MLVKSTLLLACAAVALARDAILSRGIFLGHDTTDPEATPLEIFQKPKNHATAAATIMRLLGDELGFTPHQESPAELNKSFDEWMTSIVSFRGFHMSEPPISKDIKLEGGRDKLEETILKHIDWMPDYEVIAKELVSLIPEYNDDRSLKDFGLNVIMIDEPVPIEDRLVSGGGGGDHPPQPKPPRQPDDRKKNKVLLRFFALDLKLDTAILFKWVTVPDQRARIGYTELEVDREFMIKHAEDLAQRTEKSLTNVADMMWYFTSPKKFAFSRWWPKEYDNIDGDWLYHEQSRLVYRPRDDDRRILEWLRM